VEVSFFNESSPCGVLSSLFFLPGNKPPAEESHCPRGQSKLDTAHFKPQSILNHQTMKKLIALALSMFAASAMAAEFPDISIADLKAAMEKKEVVIIDVNGAASYKAGHIPGAVDFATKGADLGSALPSNKDALVVAYCGGPSCSAYKRAAQKAAELGYTNVKHLSAGKSGWAKAGETLEPAK